MQIDSGYKPSVYYESESKQILNWRNMEERKIYKLFLILVVSLSLGSESPVSK